MKFWVTEDRLAGLHLVEDKEVVEGLSAFNRSGEIGAAEAYVIGGKRYCSSVEAAERRGWDDMATFWLLVELYERSLKDGQVGSSGQGLDR